MKLVIAFIFEMKGCLLCKCSFMSTTHKGCFFTEEELIQMQSNVETVVADIGENPYFKKYWGAIPELATLTYCDIKAIGIDTLKELYTRVNQLCN